MMFREWPALMEKQRGPLVAASVGGRGFSQMLCEDELMGTGPTKMIVLLVCSALYWEFVCQVTGVKEPWDADSYWRLWYPASLVLSAVAGLIFKKWGWTAGAILTLSQLPIMWLNNGTGPLWAAGLLTLCVLALPAVAISTLTGWFTTRPRSV